MRSFTIFSRIFFISQSLCLLHMACDAINIRLDCFHTVENVNCLPQLYGISRENDFSLRALSFLISLPSSKLLPNEFNSIHDFYVAAADLMSSRELANSIQCVQSRYIFYFSILLWPFFSSFFGFLSLLLIFYFNHDRLIAFLFDFFFLHSLGYSCNKANYCCGRNTIDWVKTEENWICRFSQANKNSTWNWIELKVYWLICSFNAFNCPLWYAQANRSRKMLYTDRSKANQLDE